MIEITLRERLKRDTQEIGSKDEKKAPGNDVEVNHETLSSSSLSLALTSLKLTGIISNTAALTTKLKKTKEGQRPDQRLGSSNNYATVSSATPIATSSRTEGKICVARVLLSALSGMVW